MFRWHLLRRWRQIEADWLANSTSPGHCAKNAPNGSQCPSRNTSDRWFADCPCEPSSPLHNNRPNDGPTYFIVPSNNVAAWHADIIRWADLEELGITYVCKHSSNKSGAYQTSRALQNEIRTTGATPVRRGKRMEPSVHFGVPRESSSSIWILSTWQSWDQYAKKTFCVYHTYSHKVNKQIKTVEQEDFQLHAGLWIVDESHNVKNPGKGPWRLAEQMKLQRPDIRPWTLAMSGTIISADPTDLLASVSVISSPSWNDPAHPLHGLRPDGLKEARKVLARYAADPNPTTKDQANQVVNAFRSNLANILIRRHDGSRWNGERLINLPALHSRRVAVKFPSDHVASYQQMFSLWAKANMRDLLHRQQQWDANKHDAKYIKENPDRPTSLRADRVINGSRILRVCANLPYLAQLVPTVGNETQRWTNDEIQKNCQSITTGRIKAGCILDQHYANLVRNCPKLDGIARILSSPRHRGAAALIMSSFPEFLLVAERVSCCLLSIAAVMSMRVHAALRPHSFESFVIMSVLTDSLHIVSAPGCLAPNAHVSWHLIQENSSDLRLHAA